jgi:hypothetical protein
VSGTVTVRADASDDKGVTKVEFFDGTTSLGIDSNGSNGWSVSWNTTSAADGGHTLRAIATDSAGQTATSAAVQVTVSNGQSGQVLEIPIGAAADDAEELASGVVDLTSSDLELVSDGGKLQTVGLRFTGIPLARGATITNAYVQFQTDEISTGAANLTLQGQAADNAAAFTTATSNVSSRTRTAASVAWAPPEWTVIGATGADQRTPNLATVLQEIVDRSGWTSGNALALIITGTGRRTAEAFQTAPAVLHIETTG